MSDPQLRQKLIRRTSMLFTPDGACAVDEPLKAAIDAGIISGDLLDHRLSLAVVISEAWGEALIAKGDRDARAATKERRVEAQKLAEALDAMAHDLLDEARALTALLQATETVDGETDAVVAKRFRQAEGFTETAKEARRIASEREDAPTYGNRTDHFARGFFVAFLSWWTEYVRPTNADANKARDMIAEALAFDLGLIPEGYPIGAFARYGFKKFRP